MQREFERKKMELELRMLQKKAAQIERMKANEESFEKKMVTMGKQLAELSI